MRKIFLLFAAFLLHIGTTLSAQGTGTIQIGSGTSTSSYFPIYSCYEYNYSQQIYLASEFSAAGGVAGNITKMRFNYMASGTTLTNWSDWTVYLGHTTKSSFASDTDWVPATSLTQVFQGTITAVAGSWVEITFTTPFNYDGTSNLLVAVDENSAGYSCTASWRSYSVGSSRALLYYSDTNNPDPAAPPAANSTTETNIAQIQFESALASCVAPTGLGVGTLTSSTADVSWTASVTPPANGYDVYYSTSNTAPTSTTTPSVSGVAGTSTTLTGLTPATQYYFWVRSQCSSSDVSSWVNGGSFSTNCVPATVPMIEGFETGYTHNTPVANCWSQESANGTSVWIANNTLTSYNRAPRTGAWNAFLQYGNEDWLIRPVQLTGGVSYTFEVYARQDGGTASNASITLAYGSTASPAAFTTITGPTGIINGTYQKVSGEFTPTTSGVYYVGINGNINGSPWYISIDDIKLDVTPTCVEPLSPVITGSSLDSISLSWTAPSVAPAGGYDVFYSTVNTPPTATTAPSMNVPGTTATITGLTASTIYYIWVRSHCSTTDHSVWVSVGSGYTGHCLPTGGASSTSYYLNSLSTTGAQTNVNYTASSYTAYVDNSASVIASYPGGSFDYAMASAGGSTYYYYMWVDWNNDLDFDDANETIFATTSYSATNSGTLTIPAGTPLGNYRVRVASSYSGSITSCGPAPYGNYVDFTLSVVAPPTCLEPTAVTVSAITATSAGVSWTAPTTPVTGYEVYYSTTNTPPTATTVLDANNSVIATGTTATISNLLPSTKYYVWVRSVCSTTDKSIWSLQASFTTLCQPPAITGTTGQYICPNTSATLSATADPGATITWYDAATGGTVLGTGSTFTTPPLAATTTYYVAASTGTTTNVGKTGIETTASGTGGGLSSYLSFTADSDFVLQTVDVFPYSSVDGTAGTITIELRTGTGTPITSTTVNVIGHNTTSAAAQTVTLNFPISGGESYRLGVSAWTGVTNMYRDNSNLAYPYTAPGLMSITGSNLSGFYYFFYNWGISTKCEGPTMPVVATVDCALGTSEIDAGVKNNIYPNPFTDVVNISDIKDVKNVTIIDMSGRVVKSIANPARQLNLGDLKAGMYILKVDYKNGSSKSVKAIKK